MCNINDNINDNFNSLLNQYNIKINQKVNNFYKQVTQNYITECFPIILFDRQVEDKYIFCAKLTIKDLQISIEYISNKGLNNKERKNICNVCKVLFLQKYENEINIMNNNKHLQMPIPSYILDNWKDKKSYIIPIISQESFLYQGAEQIEDCYIQFLSDNSESLATIGIPVKYYEDLIKKRSYILEKLKMHTKLQNIKKIERLKYGKLKTILRLFQKIFIESHELINLEKDLILFNIEPICQTTKENVLYPWPSFFPIGGNMEEIDNNNYKACAIREFKEETNINLQKYDIIKEYKTLKTVSYLSKIYLN